MTRRDPSPVGGRLVVLAGGLLLAAALVAGAAWVVSNRSIERPGTATTPPSVAAEPVETLPESTTTSLAETTTTVPLHAARVGLAHGSTVGLTMFRGNPTRTFYGTGPVPAEAPEVLWTYPEQPMCGLSTVGGETTQWCGSGWTGQPAVWVRPDGVTEVVFGAYDKAVHFVNASTGEDTRPPFPTGDIIKGSVTIDPDGYPLLYTGSRDNKLRIIGLDASAVPGVWNDDWDGNPVVVDDVLYEGGENGWFFAIRLNRQVDGVVSVDPEILVEMPGYDDELLATVGRNVSIESSVAYFDGRVYFANSGGRVVGVDVSEAASGEAPIVFDYWAGDDIDATVVIDAEGMLYVAVEQERKNERSAEVGQLVKLDPYADGDPRVWGVAVTAEVGDGGIWATPALHGGHVYVPTHTGRLLAVDADTGEVTWEDEVGPHAWSSAVVVDGVLMVATCEVPELRAYRLDDPARPEAMWTVTDPADGCIESTPAVWEGRLYVGSRDGHLRAYGAPGAG
jgi:outer membrane protein assembly factor BamB